MINDILMITQSSRQMTLGGVTTGCVENVFLHGCAMHLERRENISESSALLHKLTIQTPDRVPCSVRYS